MTDTRITDFEAVAPFSESPKTECKHESNGICYTSMPPQYKCKHCGVFYRLGMTGAHTIPPKLYTQADLDAAVQKERIRCATHIRLAINKVSEAANAINPKDSAIDGLHRKALETTAAILQITLDEVEEVFGKEPPWMI